jgi:Holliday junction DNA helicase RuvA
VIGKLKGLLDGVDEETLILDVGGVGYLVSASARTLRALPPAGQPVTLLIETQVREDAIRLFGFLNAAERDWFRILLNVQGVGAKVALALLGVLSPDALSTAIQRQDKAMLARAPGVGPKLAARLVTELKDKAPAHGAVDFGSGPIAAAADGPSRLPKTAEDAVLALVGLGYQRPQAIAAVAKGFAALGAEAQTSALIKAGLKELAQ